MMDHPHHLTCTSRGPRHVSLQPDVKTVVASRRPVKGITYAIITERPAGFFWSCGDRMRMITLSQAAVALSAFETRERMIHDARAQSSAKVQQGS